MSLFCVLIFWVKTLSKLAECRDKLVKKCTLFQPFMADLIRPSHGGALVLRLNRLKTLTNP